ncbi:MAG: type II toxin-antitoxin system Phd/YefM family antitoxin [Holophagales bacterium]|nr:type II toxin-antitoxin system Phd/YefM family antitoxin [Holophagales bacterium]
MRRLSLREDIRPVTEFRSNTASLIEQVQRTKRALVLTQRGHSAAVVMDVDEYERLLEELELLRDIQRAEEQLQRGEGVSHEAARDRVLKALS